MKIIKFIATSSFSLLSVVLISSGKAYAGILKIYTDAFIPFNTLNNPAYIPGSPCTPLGTCYDSFKGDGATRGFVKNKTAARMWSEVIIDAPPGKSSTYTSSHDTGITEGLDSSGTVIGTAKASTSGMSESVTGSITGVGSSITVNITGAANNPLVSPSPNIDYMFMLDITKVTGGWNYTLSGSHDGFPAYSVFLNSRLIYSHSPIATGQTLFSLFPPKEFSASASGTLPHSVPEPLTILGSATALGFGALLKREHSKKQKES